jgi:glycosyltransferase involved in cell wall biosynthesis
MRVLHLYAGNLFGGTEMLLVTLARLRGLCPSMEPHFALCFDGRLTEELRAVGAPVDLLGPVRIRRPWTVWQARRRLDQLLVRLRPGVVLCHGCWPHVLFAPRLRRQRLPLVYFAHDMAAGRHWLERWARQTRPDLVLTNSRATQATLPNLFPDVPCEVVYLPVPPPEVVNRDQVRKQLRETLQTPANAVVIIQSCRLEAWKGHHLLVQALSHLRDVPNWVCWISGGAQRPHEQAYLAQLHQATKDAGLADRVRFLGQRKDVPHLLAAADIHCQPNTRPEPFGIAFVEALYAGLPVVTTALGGPLEIVEDDCGILVPPGSATALAEALRRLIEDEASRASLATAGPARARALCDPATQMGRLASWTARIAQGGLAA